MKMSNFERKYSPGYCQMNCMYWKTKLTSEKGLFTATWFHKLLLGYDRSEHGFQPRVR